MFKINNRNFLSTVVPCVVTPCGLNTQCTNNADATRTCSCNSGNTPTDGSSPANGCDRKFFMRKRYFVVNLLTIC